MGVNTVKDGCGKPVTAERVEELMAFLRGQQVEGITCRWMPRLSSRAAFSVIYFLQEHMNLLPDRFEVCGRCGVLFDSEQEGRYVEKTGKNYCDGCD
jgi:hypothetical protein